jgi:hypothetical protein
MEDLIDLIATDQSAAKVSDKIKELLYVKAADRIDSVKPIISNSIFGDGENQSDVSEEE